MKNKFYGINEINDVSPGWFDKPKINELPNFIYVSLEALALGRKTPDNLVLMFSKEQLDELFKQWIVFEIKNTPTL